MSERTPGPGPTFTVERTRRLSAPPVLVWTWMCDPVGLELFRVNPFHATASADLERLDVGAEIAIEHRLGPYREPRIARISRMSLFEIAWGESATGGDDWFPHSQRFRLTADGDAACVITNTLRGAFRLPGAGLWLMPWYRHVLPWVLDVENYRIARRVERRQLSPSVLS